MQLRTCAIFGLVGVRFELCKHCQLQLCHGFDKRRSEGVWKRAVTGRAGGWRVRKMFLIPVNSERSIEVVPGCDASVTHANGCTIAFDAFPFVVDNRADVAEDSVFLFNRSIVLSQLSPELIEHGARLDNCLTTRKGQRYRGLTFSGARLLPLRVLTELSGSTRDL